MNLSEFECFKFCKQSLVPDPVKGLAYVKEYNLDLFSGVNCLTESVINIGELVHS